MWTAYFDESGSHDDSEIFAVGGYIGHDERWVEFSSEWQRILDSAGIETFHMSEFESRLGPFKCWDNAKRFEVIGELTETLRKFELRGSGRSVDSQAWKAIGLRFFRDVDGNPLDPYLFCLRTCCEEVLAQCGSEPAGSVKLVFEHGYKRSAAAAREFEATKANLDWKCMGEMTFADAKGCPPLQAADFVAYEAFKLAKNRVLGLGPSAVRKSLLRASPNGEIGMKYFGESELRKLLADLRMGRQQPSGTIVRR